MKLVPDWKKAWTWLSMWFASVIVAWGLSHPFRQILLFFAVPVSGQSLVWITVGGTVLFALFTGVGAFVPHLLAEGIAWLHVSGKGPGPWLRKIRLPRRKCGRLTGETA